ncbi:Fc.00g113650.m01.CDS01 [Cosmosporella sp. VM-42]
MVRSVFVPSRNSRHRTAALALYRALIKTGRKIPLPHSLPHPRPINPVAQLIKKRFAKNINYTSLRLVYTSMAAGYKFLTLLTKGQTPNSPEHIEIVNHLRSRFKAFALNNTKRPPLIPISEYAPPLLTKVSGPSDLPEYASTIRPRPRTAFEGGRKVPHVVATAEGQPFLRDRKPQPRVLSRAIRRRDAVMVRKVSKIGNLEQQIIPAAEEEDNWDRLIRKQTKLEGLEDQQHLERPLENYTWNAQLSRIWGERQIEKTWKDWVARGKALQQIVNDESFLAGKESGGGATSHDEDSSRQDNSLDSDGKTASTGTSINGTLAASAFEDPFLSDEWAASVQKAEAKYFKEDRHQKYQQSNPGRNQDFPAAPQHKKQQTRIDWNESENSPVTRAKPIDNVFKPQRKYF